MAVTINIRNFYYWYTQDVFIEVSDEVAAEFLDDMRYEWAYQRRTFYNKAHYSLDAGDGIEESALACYDDCPERVFGLLERYCDLCHALNSLPEIQGRRIDAHYLLGKTQTEIAQSEGVSEVAVHYSIQKGLAAMRNFLKKI